LLLQQKPDEIDLIPPTSFDPGCALTK